MYICIYTYMHNRDPSRQPLSPKPVEIVARVVGHDHDEAWYTYIRYTNILNIYVYIYIYTYIYILVYYIYIYIYTYIHIYIINIYIYIYIYM